MIELKEEPNLINEESDLDKITGNLMPDRIIQKWEMPYTNRRSHNYELWTPLESKLVTKAAICSLHKALWNLNKHLEDQTKKDLVNILSACRDYIDIYFNSTNTHPIYVQRFDKWSQDPLILRKLINDAQAWLYYFWWNVTSKNMQEQITVTSLYLREIIANTIWFSDVAHFPSQVKNKLINYKLKAFLLDSHYFLWEDWKIIDCRHII